VVSMGETQDTLKVTQLQAVVNDYTGPEFVQDAAMLPLAKAATGLGGGRG
jgi:hypothetical protein